MAAPVYHNGADGKMFITPPGASTPIQLPVSKWSGTFTANSQEVSNSKDGKFRIPGVDDAEGDASIHWDSANNVMDPTASTGPNVRPGVIMAAVLVPDGGIASETTSFRLTIIIETVKPTSDFPGTVDFDITWKLQSGTIKFPGDT